MYHNIWVIIQKREYYTILLRKYHVSWYFLSNSIKWIAYKYSTVFAKWFQKVIIITKVSKCNTISWLILIEDGGVHRHSGSELSLLVQVFDVFACMVCVFVHIKQGKQDLQPTWTSKIGITEWARRHSWVSSLTQDTCGHSQDAGLSVDYTRQGKEVEASQGQEAITGLQSRRVSQAPQAAIQTTAFQHFPIKCKSPHQQARRVEAADCDK